ncbi:MAG: hypothetical protein JST69_11520 [Bacteroidetes bacterium]|nr:hypothetical protein [Bacteroidota bacterium]
MKQAFFITGFNNWGKSTIIFDLFGKKKFLYGYLYRMNGVNFSDQFTVQSQSNDDLWGQEYVDKVNERIAAAPVAPEGGQNLFSALCPSIENTNSFVQILTNPPFTNYDKLHILLIEYKWEHHAKLITKNIIQAGSQIVNANFIIINADQNFNIDGQRRNAKMSQIRSELNNIFGTP